MPQRLATFVCPDIIRRKYKKLALHVEGGGVLIDVTNYSGLRLVLRENGYFDLC